MRPAAALAAIALAGLAWPAAAQPADPIGDILSRQPQVDEDSAESGRVTPKVEAEPSIPDVPQGPAPRLTKPVHIEETGKSPERPPTTRDLAYESRVRASFANAQGFQGPLDGSWTLSSPSGDLYVLELVDRGKGSVEGAWRDLRRKGAIGGSGFVDRIQRVGEEMTLTFDGGAVAQLTATADGRWSGQLTAAGQSLPVSLRRAAP